MKTKYTLIVLVSFLASAVFFINATFCDIPGNFEPQQLPAPVTTTFLQTNNINVAVSNDGIISYDRFTFTSPDAGLIWPVAAAQRLTLDYAAGIWIGAKVGPSRELRLAAAFYNSHYSPGNIPVIGQVPGSNVCGNPVFKQYQVNLVDPNLVNGGTLQKTAGGRLYTISYDSWASWPVANGAPYVEINGVPGYQPSFNGDRPGVWHTTARPDEIIFSQYMDYKNCTNSLHASELSLPGGTLPLGVEIQQVTFSFLLNGYNDMYFTKWRIINKSSQTWDSVYISLADDGDIGDGSDDAAGCDTTRNLGFIYNYDNNDADYGSAPPALGYRILQSPLRYTGNNSDTARLPFGNFIGYRQTGMSGYNVFLNGGNTCTGDPDNAINAYNFMRGKDGCGNPLINWVHGFQTTYKYSGNAVYRIDWYDSTSGDKRQLLNCGPFSMTSGSEQFLVTAAIGQRGSNNNQSVAQIIDLSDNAKNFYNNSFGGTPIGLIPVSNEVPNQFKLEQNYPNPFNPTTKIKFAIPEAGNVTLKIFDVNGKEIVTLVNQHLLAGIYETDWQGINYASGVYFYSISAGKYTETRKMILMK